MRQARWRTLLPEPFWPTLAALLALSGFAAIPLWLIGALIWPSATGLATDLIFAVGYVIAVPVTWWVFRERHRR